MKYLTARAIQSFMAAAPTAPGQFACYERQTRYAAQFKTKCGAKTISDSKRWTLKRGPTQLHHNICLSCRRNLTATNFAQSDHRATALKLPELLRGSRHPVVRLCINTPVTLTSYDADAHASRSRMLACAGSQIATKQCTRMSGTTTARKYWLYATLEQNVCQK